MIYLLNSIGFSNLNTYAGTVTVSDEAFGLLFLEDRSFLWREVALLRTADPHFNGNKSLGVKREMKSTEICGLSDSVQQQRIVV